MSGWFMVTLVGEDRPGIVAKVASALYEGGANLGEASMMRLGGNFTIMLMVQFDGSVKQLQGVLESESDSLDLRMHVDRIEGHLHRHRIPDVRVTVYGADRTGIVSQVTSALAEAGLDVTDLQSDVGGSEDKPMYIMTIEGQAREGIDALKSAIEIVHREGMDVDIEPIETMIG